MKKMLFYLAASLTIYSLTALTSCKKDEEPQNEAIIEIASPSAGQIFMGGATVPVKAILTGVEILHGWKVEIRKVADDSVVFTAESHEHAQTFSIDEAWTNNVTEHSDMVVEVFAQLDHDGTMQSQTVHFHCHPM